MKKFFSKKIVATAQNKTRQVYNPIRDRIRQHISDINDIITDEDIRKINILSSPKPNNLDDLTFS